MKAFEATFCRSVRTLIAVTLIPACIVGASAITGCSNNPFQPSSRPQLYPNKYLSEVGPSQANRDIDTCMSMADQYVQNPSKWRSAAIGTAKGAVVGTAAGAVAGTIFGRTGRGTAAGAAVGGIAGLANEFNTMGERSPSYERFTEYCLQKQGYEIVGWN